MAAKTNHRMLSQALEDFVTARDSDGLRQTSLRFYRQQVGYFVRYLAEENCHTVDSFNHYHIREYLLSLKARKLKDTSQADAWRSISAFCGFLFTEGLLLANPIDKVPRPRVGKRTYGDFSPDEVRALLDVCTTTRDAAIVICLLDSALRANEFVKLRVGDVDFGKGIVAVREGKGGWSRTAYISEQTCEVIKAYLSERSSYRPDDPLWLSQTTGERLTDDGLRQLLQRLGKKAEIERCHPHRFRGTCATWMHRSGASLYAIRDVLGHRDISVLQRYLTLNVSDVQRAHHQFGPMSHLQSEVGHAA